jgi:hypothetical protein
LIKEKRKKEVRNKVKGFKECYKCRRNLPLFMYRKSSTPPIASVKGRAYVCRLCNFIESGKGGVCRQQTNGKYKVVKLTLRERLKELFGE